MKKSIVSLIIGTLFIFSGCEDLNLGSNDSRDDITGTWRCDETNNFKSSLEVYTVEIEKDTEDSTKIIILNFYNQGIFTEVVGTYQNNVISMEPQPIANGYSLNSGSGVVSSNEREITWNYQVDDGSGILDNATATYTRFE